MKQLFTGTVTLVKLALGRDRIKLSLWTAGIGLMLLATTAGVVSVYNEPSERAAYATTAISNMGLFFNGPLDSTRIESLAITETMTFMSIFVALMSTLLVMRHTRQNEESGRSELIGAGPVGRYAQLAASLIVAAMANAAVGLFAMLALLAQGFAFDGAALTGLAFCLMGCVFAGIAAVAAQLTATARAGNGIAAASIGGFFLVRAAGDMHGKVDFSTLSSQSGWLSWLSPIGIARATQPYAGNKWWVLGILLALFGIFSALAMLIAAKRDLGASVLGTRNGRPTARRSLLSNFGLAWRLQRGLLLGWVCGLGVLAMVFGAVVEEVKKFTSASGEIAQIIAALGNSSEIVNSYLSFSIMLFGVVGSAYGIQAILRIRGEEAQGHLEQILATASGRAGWLFSHIAVVSIGVAFLLFSTGALTGIAYSLISGVDMWPTITELSTASLAYLPVALIFVGLGALAFSATPRLSLLLPWIAFVISYAVLQFGQILNLPAWMTDLSPFSHTPMLPAESLSLWPLLWMLIIAAALLLASLLALQRRDIQTA